MTINPDRTMFKVGGIVYDKEGKYIILNYHMPHVQRDGQHFIENDGMLSCMSITTGEIFEKCELDLTEQSIYDEFQEGNLVRVFKSDTVPFGDVGTIIYKNGHDYMIQINSTNEKVSIKLDDLGENFFIPRWIDQKTLECLGFQPDATGKVWSNGVVELRSAKPIVVSDDPHVNYKESLLNYGFKVYIVKEDMVLVIPPNGDNIIRAVHELQNIYTSPNVREMLDISGLLK
jgi:hypothetical protein